MRVSDSRAVDRTDWLKTVAIFLVALDHFGFFFLENEGWWTVFGRFAAPPFFFLLGYATTRRVPLTWIWLGVFLTLLDSWNNDWSWVAPNILLSFVLIRLARPHIQDLLLSRGWTALVVTVIVLIALLPIADEVVEFGAAGWLWALLGLCQRLFVDELSANEEKGKAREIAPALRQGISGMDQKRLFAGLAAATAYIWQEQSEFLFPGVEFAVFVSGILILLLGLICFRRGPSRIRPPATLAGVLRFCGHHTLEIYAIQLAGSELLILLLPELAG